MVETIPKEQRDITKDIETSEGNLRKDEDPQAIWEKNYRIWKNWPAIFEQITGRSNAC